jgi:hypothetical protein
VKPRGKDRREIERRAGKRGVTVRVADVDVNVKRVRKGRNQHERTKEA